MNEFMKVAILEAEENLKTNAGGPFGACIVKDNEIVETSLNLEFDYTDTLKDDKSGFGKKTMHSSLNLMCDAFEKQGYFDCYYSAEDYIYTITMGLDLKDFASDADTSKLLSTNLEDVKKAIESQKDLEVSSCVIEKK